MSTHSVNNVIAAYVKARDQRKELADLQKDQMAPFNHRLEVLGAFLLDELNKSGAESIRGNNGTASKSSRVSVKIDNWDETLPYIIENNLTHLLEKRLAKSGVIEYIEANGEAPPGVSISSELVVQVRRPSD